MKYYVLDTNVILRDFTSIYSFDDNVVVLPSVVLEEIDSKKKLSDGVGLNARAAARELDKLREQNSLHQGVVLHNGGVLYVAYPPNESPVYDRFMSRSIDNAVLATAFDLLRRVYDSEVVVVSLDVNVRVKANVVGLRAEDYQSDKVLTSVEDQYKGFRVVNTDSSVIDAFYKHKETDVGGNENEFIILRNGKQSAIGRVRDGLMRPLYHYKDEPVWGLVARNVEQKMAFDLLLDPEIPLVTITGRAGTGKTLLALASALKQVLDDKLYSKILVARPIVPMGRDIGYLPGEIDEKLRPWMQPIYDNLEHLFECKKDGDLENILAGMSREFKVEALTYIRGRSIPNQFIIIDEAQNLNKHEVKTVLTRLGEGSKIVLVGDTQQIDHPFLDQFSNGLTYAIETLKGQKLVGHIHLEKGERSAIAQLCTDLL